MSQFESKLNTNYIPTLQECESIKTFLLEPQILLDELHGRILQQEAILRQLRGQYDKLYKVVDSHRALLSPIRQVPDDILREIFFHCLPYDHNATFSPRDPPVSLTHICSPWRKVALTTPRLWSSLHIYSYCAEEKEVQDTTVDERDTFVKGWISRAGDVPLSLSLFPKPPTHPFISNPDDIQRLLTLVSSSSRRWDTLEMLFAMNYEDRQKPRLRMKGNVNLAFCKVRKLSLHLQITQLFMLEIHCPLTVASALLKNLSLNHNTHLRELSLSINVDPKLPFPLAQYIPCARLEVLDLRDPQDTLRYQVYPIDTLGIATLLRQCPNLIAFKVNVLKSTNTDSNVVTTSSQQQVVMPKLKHLYFALSDLQRLDHVCSIFDYVCPKLLSFHLRGRNYGKSPSPILSAYLQKVGSSLTSLTLDSSVPIASILPALPALVQLHLEGVILADPVDDDDDSDVEESDPSLNIEAMEILTPSPDGSVPPLCPSLQYLRWENTHFSDDSLAKMILARATSPFTKPFKQVHIYFGRQRTRDILPDCKELVQTGLDLRLEYARPKKNPKDALFAKLGLPPRQDHLAFGWS